MGGSGGHSCCGQTGINLPVEDLKDRQSWGGISGDVRLSVIGLTNGQSWGGVAGDVGTVVVTSLADGRVVGNFTGTLQPLGDATGTLLVSGGHFDVRIDVPRVLSGRRAASPPASHAA